MYYVRKELEEQKRGIQKERENQLQSVKVVGVTCAASTFPILNPHKFNIGTATGRFCLGRDHTPVITVTVLTILRSVPGRVQPNARTPLITPSTLRSLSLSLLLVSLT
jgi:hypothetical protein